MLKASLPFVLSLIALAPAACSAAGSEEEEDLDASNDELNRSSSQQLEAEFRQRAACTKSSANDRTCLSESEVATLLREAGFPEGIIAPMVCAARVESGYRTNNQHTNSDKSIDRGLFQINSIHIGDPNVNPRRIITQGCPSTANGLFDPATNTECALAVYQGQQRGNRDPRYGIARAWYAYKKFKVQCDAFRLSESASAIATDRALDDGASTGTDLSGGPGPAPSIDDPTPVATPGATSPPASSSAPGSCFAGTLGKMLPPGGCYARQSDGAWFQCSGGQWFRGVDAEGFAGPFGTCQPSCPLGGVCFPP